MTGQKQRRWRHNTKQR